MLQFVRLEIRDHRGKLRVAVADFGELLAIMAIDFGLYRHSACHRCFRADCRRHRAKGKACSIPDRVQCRRAHAAFGHHFVKCVEVAFLLLGHVRDAPRGRGAIAHNGKLPLINAFRTKFTRLIHADHAFDCQFPLSGGFQIFLLRHIIAKMSIAPPNDKRKLYPASEIPNKVHGATSHRTNGAFMIDLSKSSPLPEIVAVQAVRPFHQPYSTPA